jgi:cysteine-rich repeat protein
VVAGLLSLIAGCSGEELSADTCGDFVVQASEACDDGDIESGDGCSATCAIETGWACGPGTLGSRCATVCGDGVMAAAEQCDDGNLAAGDGCSATCSREITEDCNDGFDNDSDGLTDCADPDCGPAGVCANESCANGIDDNGNGLADCADPQCATDIACVVVEVCDDGVDNDNNGAVDCLDETCDCSCGDGRRDTGEECDDGDGNSNSSPDACRLGCLNAACGDGVEDTGEACDLGEANGQRAACSVECNVNIREACGTESTGYRLDVLATPTNGVWQVPITVSSDWGDDSPAVEGCASGNGLDAELQFVAAEAGTYMITVTGALDGGAAIVGRPACDAEADACGVTDAVVRHPAVSAELGVGEGWRGVLDLYRQTTGVLTVRVALVSEFRSEGESCDPMAYGTPCVPYLRCDFVNNARVCTDTPAGLPAAGDACNASEGCARGLTCSRGVCGASLGTACDRPIASSDLEAELGRGTSEWSVTPAPALSTIASSCGSFDPVAIMEFDPTASGIVTLQAVSAGGGSVAVGVRSLCGTPASELSCDRGLGGDELTMQFRVQRGVPVFVFASSTAPVSMQATLVEEIALGGACSDAGASVCVEGTVCRSGRCAEAPAGACQNPLSLLENGVGELSGRGLTVGVNTTGLPGQQASECGGAGPEQVFGFTAPNAGLVTALYVPEDLEPGSVTASTDCSGAATLGCASATEELKFQVRAGRYVRLVVDTENAGESTSGSLIVALAARIDIGQPCSTTVNCLDGSYCDGSTNRCIWAELPEGADCDLDGAPCTSGSICFGPRGSRECVAAVAGLGEFCDLGGAGPQCDSTQRCDADAGSVCVAAPGGRRAPCEVDRDCRAPLTCATAGFCSDGVFIPGDPCILEAPGGCGSSMVCAIVAGIPECVPSGGGTEGSMCSAEQGCNRGLECLEQPSGGSICRRQLVPGDTCDPTPGQNPCPLSFACRDDGAGLQCVFVP